LKKEGYAEFALKVFVSKFGGLAKYADLGNAGVFEVFVAYPRA
jgi:hypothetical protein